MMELNKLSDEEVIFYQEQLDFDGDISKKKKCHEILDLIRKDITLMNKTIDELYNYLSSNTLDETFNDKLCKLIRIYEKSNSKVRTLPIEFGCKYEREEYSKNVAPADISIRLDNDILKITMPSLLPKRSIGSTDLKALRHSYYNAFYEFFKNGKYKVYEDKVVIVFTHHYDKDTPMRDNDNTETKVIIDLISTFTLIDDNPNWCDIYIKSVNDERTFSEVEVIPKSKYIIK